jgi:hypothetical protein
MAAVGFWTYRLLGMGICMGKLLWEGHILG